LQDALRVKKALGKAQNEAGVTPARLCNAAQRLFDRNPKGMGQKQRHSALHG
jgi:hypothetical protein